MLTEEKKEYFKGLLTQMLHELLAEVNKAVSGFTGPKDGSPDFIDQASMGSNTDFSFLLRERKGKLIVKIKTALEKLDEGDFGICEECGEEISEERLKARPMAALCIVCKKKQEAQERRRGL